MYVVRNVFTCKPGKVQELVAKFKAAEPYLAEMEIHNVRILSDTSAGFWTVVVESEVSRLDDYFGALSGRAARPELQEAMGGYMDLVTGGHREIFKLEE